MTQIEEGVYLFCFARADAVRDLALAGLSDSDGVGTLEAGGTAAVICSVPVGDFEARLGGERVEDPAWVIERACAHERVIEAVMARSPVLPARFGAIFASRASLGRFLASRHQEISQFLDSVADKEEWGLKAFVDAHKAGESLLFSEPALAEQIERLASSPGARYFQEKQLRAKVTRHVELWSRQVADQIQKELAVDAVGICPLPLLPRSFSERPDDMILNCALLLPLGGVADFARRAEALSARLEPQGIAIELSGPWPPYSFCPPLNAPDTEGGGA